MAHMVSGVCFPSYSCSFAFLWVHLTADSCTVSLFFIGYVILMILAFGQSSMLWLSWLQGQFESKQCAVDLGLSMISFLHVFLWHWSLHILKVRDIIDSNVCLIFFSSKDAICFWVSYKSHFLCLVTSPFLYPHVGLKWSYKYPFAAALAPFLEQKRPVVSFLPQLFVALSILSKFDEWNFYVFFHFIFYSSK